MRRWIILLSILFLGVGAVAMAPALHLQIPVAALFGPSEDASSPSSHAPLTAADMSPTKQSSENGLSAAAEHSENSASADQGAKPKSGDGDASSSDAVKLDLAQISTSGSTSVFAGRAAPGAPVTIFENGIPVASAKANANGDWSLATDHKFAGPEPKFSLRTGSFPIPGEDQAADAKAPPGAISSRPLASQAANRPDSASPSRELLKSFENKVASAREEVATQHQAENAVSAKPAAPVDGPPTALADSKSMKGVTADLPSPAEVRDSTHSQSTSIPVPMTFVFDEATLTPDGEKTARLLLEYLQLKKYTSVTLSGHADERGTADYNMDLSRKRLETVQAFLRSGGYQGKLDLVPKGASEPFAGVDRSKYSIDDLMQLDRRVELRTAM
jgi:outer membrane protein OmpA-like peptidoglycan-associated protein